MNNPIQEKSLMERASNLATQGSETVRATASSAAQETNNLVDGIRQQVSNAMGDFSSQVAVDANASKDFLTSNTIISRIGFILLVLIVFFFALRVCMSIMGYFLSPSTAPYLVYGMLNGNQSQVISQNPGNTNAVPILRSNNQPSGIECSWSLWLYIDPGNGNTSNPTTTFQNVFVKGDGIFDPNTGISSVDNAPGLYLDSSGGVYNLDVFYDVSSLTPTTTTEPLMAVSAVPLQKWFHVCLRLQNTVLDLYINGTLAKRVVLPDVPKQNYADVYLCGGNGFPGSLSNLRYYPYALNVFQINAISWYGPNTSTSSLSSTLKANNGYTYMSNIWYDAHL